MWRRNKGLIHAFHRTSDWFVWAREAVGAQLGLEESWKDQDPPFGSIDLHTNNHFDEVNPATGLPMSGDLDVGGNPYGVDLIDDWGTECGSDWDDSASFSFGD
jgi:hypothetical protein